MKRSFLSISFLFLGAFLSARALPQDELRDQYFDSDGITIRYVESGNGVPVVLHHGYTGSLEAFLRTSVFQALANDYRVIAFDARGHGKSGKPYEAAAYGEEMSNDVIRLLDHLDISRAHVVGYSMGVRVLSKTVTSHEDRFLTFVLGGFAPARNWSSVDDENMKSRSEDFLINPPQSVIERDLDIEALATLVLGFSELAVTNEELIDLKLPMLSVIGSEDLNFESVMELKALIPRLELVVIDGATHTAAPSYTEFLESIQTFLADNTNQ